MTNENLGYNGWANWETWIINLYFGDDTEFIQEMAEQNEFDKSNMADAIENYVNDLISDIHDKDVFDGIVGEFITKGLGSVDWRELAENWLSDCEIPEEEEEEEEEE